MEYFLPFDHVIFWILIILTILTECQSRCFHSLRVGLVPGDIVFKGNEKDGCVWTLNSPDMRGIELLIMSTSFKHGDCSGSKLEIRDGTLYGGHIDDVCDGRKRTIQGSSHYIQIVYHASSDTYRTDTFQIRYTVYDASVCHAGYKLASSTEASIFSPRYPQNYPTNLDCKWLLDADSDKNRIKIQVERSSLSTLGTFCLSDYVEAFDGMSRSARSLGRWCGDDTPTKESTGRYMYLEFHTDSRLSDKGFHIRYWSIQAGLSSTHAGQIAGGITAAVVIGAFLLCLLYACHKCKWLKQCKTSEERSRSSLPPRANVYSISPRVRRRSLSSSSASSHDSYESSSHQSSSYNMSSRRPPSPREEPPPAYEDVIKNEPPSYLQAISEDPNLIRQNSSSEPNPISNSSGNLNHISSFSGNSSHMSPPVLTSGDIRETSSHTSGEQRVPIGQGSTNHGYQED